MREGVSSRLALETAKGSPCTSLWTASRRARSSRHEEIAIIGAASETERTSARSRPTARLVRYAHAEHGMIRCCPRCRVVDARTNETVADLSDGQGKGLTAWAWSPVPGD